MVCPHLTLAAEASIPNNSRLLELLRPRIYALFSQKGLNKGTPYSRPVQICVIDTGLSPRIPLLQSNITAPLNAWALSIGSTNESKNIFDQDGHGTATAGIIHQFTPRSFLIPVKSFEEGVGTAESLLIGLRHCVDQKADIINISGSGHEFVKKFILAHSQTTKNTLFVMAAGNFKEQIKKDFERPKNLILVGATTLSTPIKITSYSATGAGVDIYAPAGDSGDGIQTWTVDNKLRLYNGTSAAAPVVSGMAALIKEQQPDISIADLRALLASLFEAL